MIKGLQSMLSTSGDDECIKEAIQQIEQHVTSVVQDPSYEIPKNVFRLRQAQFKVSRNSSSTYFQTLNTQILLPNNSFQDKHNAKRKRSDKDSDDDNVSTTAGGGSQ
jgi:hypothetical protein